MKMLIIGAGKVGKATGDRLTCKVDYHDPFKQLIVPFDQWGIYDFIIVCVDTLQTDKDDHDDLQLVIQQITDSGYKGTVAIRSTIHPNFYKDHLTKVPFDVVMFPEFMVQRGDNTEDDPWVIVLGGSDESINDFAGALIYSTYTSNPYLFRFMSGLEAVITKLAANATLAAKVITFNAIHQACESQNINFETVRESITTDPRIGASHSIAPSPDDGLLGFGGHCLPKDIRAMADIDPTGYFYSVSITNNILRNG
jgi:UDP-glucose 6-dehydrogenase